MNCSVYIIRLFELFLHQEEILCIDRKQRHDQYALRQWLT